MRIIQEVLDKEIYIDQILTDKDIELLKEFMVLSFPCDIEGRKVNLGVKIGLENEEDF